MHEAIWQVLLSFLRNVPEVEIAVLCNLEKVKIVEVWFSMLFAVFKEHGTERGRSCHWCGDCPTYMNHFGTPGSAFGFETSSNIVRILSCKLIKVQLIEDCCAAALYWSLASNLHFDPDPSMSIDAFWDSRLLLPR